MGYVEPVISGVSPSSESSSLSITISGESLRRGGRGVGGWRPIMTRSEIYK